MQLDPDEFPRGQKLRVNTSRSNIKLKKNLGQLRI
jgi:hypothetical protein